MEISSENAKLQNISISVIGVQCIQSSKQSPLFLNITILNLFYQNIVI